MRQLERDSIRFGTTGGGMDFRGQAGLGVQPRITS